MFIQKCKWKMDAHSPVMFMIDDFANTWVDENFNGKLDVGEDWGHWAYDKNSMWDILNRNIFSPFPEVKATFFMVVGRRTPIENSSKKIYSGTILDDDKFLGFLKKIDKDPRIEIAYHGLTHGITGKGGFDFKEEWLTYKSLEEAIDTIEKGKQIFYEALGRYPRGGKYCGYQYNTFSDQSINKTGFLWWCRHWDADLEEERNNQILNYDLEMFENVVDIPSTIDGSYYSIKNVSKMFTKKYIKSIYKKVITQKSLEKSILERIKNRQIISIQEHSSPLRADNKIQYPNIISDLKNLQSIFTYLKKFNIWYANGTEIAEYFLTYEKSEIKIIDKYSFLLVLNDNNIEGKELTVKVGLDNIKEEVIYVYTDKERYILNKSDGFFKGTIRVYENKIYKIKVENNEFTNKSSNENS